MIESSYWKEDLLSYAKKFAPVSRPPRWSERLQVNFEKDIILAFFMIRKLSESLKFSPITLNFKAQVFRYPCVSNVNSFNFWDIETLYDLQSEETVKKDIKFICNQLIHGGATYAYRDKSRNWAGIYTCSDFERAKYVYRIPLSEIIKILNVAGNDYAQTIVYTYIDNKEDYKVTVY